MADKLDQEALDYHCFPTPGKVAVVPTKPLANQHDFSLAYSPGVVAASMLIHDDPAEAANMTALMVVEAQSETDEELPL